MNPDPKQDDNQVPVEPVVSPDTSPSVPPASPEPDTSLGGAPSTDGSLAPDTSGTVITPGASTDTPPVDSPIAMADTSVSPSQASDSTTPVADADAYSGGTMGNAPTDTPSSDPSLAAPSPSVMPAGSLPPAGSGAGIPVPSHSVAGSKKSSLILMVVLLVLAALGAIALLVL